MGVFMRQGLHRTLLSIKFPGTLVDANFLPAKTARFMTVNLCCRWRSDAVLSTYLPAPSQNVADIQRFGRMFSTSPHFWIASQEKSSDSSAPLPQAPNHASPKDPNAAAVAQEENKETKPTLFQRFKNAYKEYGKVLIGVHLATSAVWFGCFYYLASSGVNIGPLLQSLGISESIVSKVTDSAAGDVAVAYVLYMLAKPLRYTVTLVGTHHTVRKLRQWGYMQPRKEEDRLRTLAREGRQQLSEKQAIMTERWRRASRRLRPRSRNSRSRAAATEKRGGSSEQPAEKSSGCNTEDKTR